MNGWMKDHNGKERFVLGLQMHNSSSGTGELMDKGIEAVRLYGGNTLETPLYWYQIEPEEGRYELGMVETVIRRVRDAGLHLILLWFGCSKNAEYGYVPDWVKADPSRFRLAIGPDGAPRVNLSPHDDAAYDADARCFARVMREIRRLDEGFGTVIAVQVENEVGLAMKDTDRCYSRAAQRDFDLGVPQELDGVVLEDSGTDNRGTTWYERFGRHAHEAFTSWYLARQIDRIAAAGKKEYDIPFTMNTQVGEIRQRIAGMSYASGGPCGRALDIWMIAAPHIDLFCPDIYQQDESGYRETCGVHARPDNALFIPESAPMGILSAMNCLHAVADYGAVGICGFGAENTVDFTGRLTDAAVPVAESYRAIAALEPLIIRYRGSGRVRAVTQEEFQPYAYVKLPQYHMTVHFEFAFGGLPAKSPPIHHGRFTSLPNDLGLPEKLGEATSRGRMLYVEENEYEYYFSGIGCSLRFIRRSRPDDPNPHANQAVNEATELGFLAVEEGHFDSEGRFQVDFVRNGDEISRGIAVRCGTVVRVRMNPESFSDRDW
ncbi:MAG: DUF5597 domain-containing protein [Clostridia bacterium]|nr:DUF5597 domain-containing protein [Clostridia bacterium]